MVIGSVFNFTLPYSNNRTRKQISTEVIREKLEDKPVNKIKTIIAEDSVVSLNNVIYGLVQS